MSTAAAASARPARSRRRSLLLWTALGFLVLIVVVRLVLPSLITRVVNQRLAALPDHYGIVEDVDVELLRGAYRLEGVTLRHRGADQEPLFSAADVELSLAWRELLRGRVVSDVVLHSPIFHVGPRFFAQPDALPLPEPIPEPGEPKGPGDPTWRELIQALFPIEITNLVILDGSATLDHPGHAPPLRVGLENMEAHIEGLANREPPPGETYPARIELFSGFTGGGRLHVRGRAAPLEEKPRFEAAVEIDELHLPTYNALFRDVMNIDLSAGKLHVAAEISAAEGRYEGYLKPLIRDARFEDVSGQPGGAVKKVWESIVGAATSVLTNNNSDRAGTRVPFSGEFGNPEIGAWDAFVSLLRNAFVRALREGVDESVAEVSG